MITSVGRCDPFGATILPPIFLSTAPQAMGCGSLTVQVPLHPLQEWRMHIIRGGTVTLPERKYHPADKRTRDTCSRPCKGLLCGG